MVAIKPAHIRLHDKDLWPGLPWKWGDEHKIRDMLREELISQGITEHPELFFAEARAWEKYLQQFPRFGDRQKILKKIYPPKPPDVRLPFTKDVIEYLIEKLDGINDPLGQDILQKLLLTNVKV